MAADSQSYVLVGADEVFSFVQRCMVAAGVEEPHAVDLATLLLAADTRGHFSHGINRLGKKLSTSLVSSFFHVISTRFCTWKIHSCMPYGQSNYLEVLYRRF